MVSNSVHGKGNIRDGWEAVRFDSPHSSQRFLLRSKERESAHVPPVLMLLERKVSLG